jgi:flavin-binding protein dodecin
MAVLKVIEILGESEESWEDAARQVVQEASKSLEGIQSIYIKEMYAEVKDNEIRSYRVNGKVTFTVQAS